MPWLPAKAFHSSEFLFSLGNVLPSIGCVQGVCCHCRSLGFVLSLDSRALIIVSDYALFWIYPADDLLSFLDGGFNVLSNLRCDVSIIFENIFHLYYIFSGTLTTWV